MDWNQIRTDPLIIGVAAAVVVILLLIVILQRRRRGSKEPDFPVPQVIASRMGDYCPAFTGLIEAYTAKNSLTSLLENQEVADSFDKLQNFLQETGAFKKAKGKKKEALQLQFQDDDAKNQLSAEAKAAMLTVARQIYSKAEYSSSLDEASRQHFDDLLDVLT